MHVMHTLRADLNLVPALAVLLDERHISRSANRLGLSQPATSRALQRLRNLLGDELLVRDRDGYRLTARAEVLRAQLAEVLPALEALVAPDSFDPASASTPIDIAGTDFAVHTYGAAICARLMAESPGPKFVSTAGASRRRPSRSTAAVWSSGCSAGSWHLLSRRPSC
ncbi:LysR family transcriptional regulator [Mycobacterium sp. pW049]|uniref:LysR family transcriptional regulator n=1 Tax=[Mycobacterium] bulgaricum TaxID=3238985 RepID=UPI00351B5843